MTASRRVLVVGSGAREHALASRLLQSDSVGEVLVSPGNAGTRGVVANSSKVLRSISGDPVALAVSEGVDLVVVGPEVPLCEGLADRIRASGIACYGPSGAAARLEGSKAFMKSFCQRHHIPTALDVVVKDAGQLEAALARFVEPPVVKADGLCAGKGVVVAESFDEARFSALDMLSGQSFGAAGTTVVLEERLYGAEASIHAICDGERALLLPAAQDHKRIHDGDQGPNTGGMGTYAPAPVVTDDMIPYIQSAIMDRVVQGMKAEGMPFVGTLFAGLMISPAGQPKVLEFNVRFGDPETQVLTQIVEGDWFDALFQAARGRLQDGVLSASGRHSLCVVMAAAGYPGTPRAGDVIDGLGAGSDEDVSIFHAGTKAQGDQVVTAGGRVLGVTGRGSSLQAARDRAYAAVDRITFAGAQYRRDIGHRAL